MLDFYFEYAIPFEELKNDENLKIYEEPKDSAFYNESCPRYFIELVNEDGTCGWTYRDDYLIWMEGHDAAIPVAMYIFDKYGVIFGDDPRLSTAENLDYMEWLLHNVKEEEPYKSIYEKIEKLKGE